MAVNFRKKQRGIGLLELMLSLAIIAVLLVMATRYYESAHRSEQMNQLVGIVQVLRSASADWVAGKPNYEGIGGTPISVPQLILYGLIPTEIQDAGKSGIITPWHGTTVTVSPDSSTEGRKVQVVINDFPTYAAGVCQNLAGKFDSIGAKCSNNTFTVDFG